MSFSDTLLTYGEKAADKGGGVARSVASRIPTYVGRFLSLGCILMTLPWMAVIYIGYYGGRMEWAMQGWDGRTLGTMPVPVAVFMALFIIGVLAWTFLHLGGFIRVVLHGSLTVFRWMLTVSNMICGFLSLLPLLGMAFSFPFFGIFVCFALCVVIIPVYLMVLFTMIVMMPVLFMALEWVCELLPDVSGMISVVSGIAWFILFLRILSM